MDFCSLATADPMTEDAVLAKYHAGLPQSRRPRLRVAAESWNPGIRFVVIKKANCQHFRGPKDDDFHQACCDSRTNTAGKCEINVMMIDMASRCHARKSTLLWCERLASDMVERGRYIHVL